MQAEATALPGHDRSSPCALRILARHDDRQILIVHGEDRVIVEGERLAWIDWLPSVEIAAAVSDFCSRKLTQCRFPPDPEGWHGLAVEHLTNLLNLARNEFGLTYHSRPAPPRERQAWTAERIALFGFLAGQGETGKKIADHPLIRTTEGNIFRQARRFNIALPGSSQGYIVLRRIPASAKAKLERAAEREGLTPEAFASRLLITALEGEARLAATT